MGSFSRSNQWHVPLFKALMDLYGSKPVSFHVPGHKYGQSLGMLEAQQPEVRQFFQPIMAADVTELSPTDDLHAPAGAIAEAQHLAAQSFGSEETFFLVGGSTSGNLAMLLACCEPGDIVLVQRNAHKSVLNGLALAGARAVFILPHRLETSGLDVTPRLSDLEQALHRYPQAKAVLLTNPSYYGLCVELGPYAQLIHSHHKLLLVDEAHGAHYGLHDAFPRSAIQAGADAVVQSTHKTLTALTMGAMLHIQGERIDRVALKHALSMIQSSSPSYPIMASLDIARAMVDLCGAALFESGLQAAIWLREWISSSEEYELAEVPEGFALQDPLRVVFRERTGILTGYEILKELERRGCWAEMADPSYVVLIIGIAATKYDIRKLIAALSEIGEKYLRTQTRHNIQPVRAVSLSNERISEPVAISRRKFSAIQAEAVPIQDSVGRKSAEAVIPYPPGIPILYPGETITADTVRYIDTLRHQGAKCQGIVDPTLNTILVLSESRPIV